VASGHEDMGGEVRIVGAVVTLFEGAIPSHYKLEPLEARRWNRSTIYSRAVRCKLRC
jgi:hypothetical protein